MTPDDIGKIVVTVVLAILGGVTGWLANTTVRNREKLIEQGGQIRALEVEVARLEKEHDKEKESRVTMDCITEAIDKALDKRDKEAEKRRAEWHRINTLEMREGIREEVKAMIPEIARELHEMAKR